MTAKSAYDPHIPSSLTYPTASNGLCAVNRTLLLGYRKQLACYTFLNFFEDKLWDEGGPKYK